MEKSPDSTESVNTLPQEVVGNLSEKVAQIAVNLLQQSTNPEDLIQNGNELKLIGHALVRLAENRENILEFGTENVNHALVIKCMLDEEGLWLSPGAIATALRQFPEFNNRTLNGQLLIIRKAIDELNDDSEHLLGVKLVRSKGKSNQRKHRLDLWGIYGVGIPILENYTREIHEDENGGAEESGETIQQNIQTSKVIDGVEYLNDDKIELHLDKNQAFVKLKAGEFEVSFMEPLEFLIFRIIAHNKDGITLSELFDELKKTDMKSPFSYTDVLRAAGRMVKNNEQIISYSRLSGSLAYMLRS